ncbi:MAG: 6-phosphogluconolactonase [Synechococcales bacterium]|nr:6-phosphogluconolactonase [Synechococcales bacterium]
MTANPTVNSVESLRVQLLEVLPDVAGIVRRSQILVVARVQEAIARRGYATLVLAGGSTPKPLYEALATESLPWDKIHIFWGDERYVPADHPDSNYRMANLAWLSQVPFPADNIHPMPTEPSDPAIAAAQYETEIRQFFQAQSEEFPAFDVVLLGMGDDAHTASLFPGTAALAVCDRLVTVGEKSGQPRLTLTVPMINAARSVMFLIAGANKQTALAQVFAAEADPTQYPSRFIQPTGELWWLLDQSAAQGIIELKTE